MYVWVSDVCAYVRFGMGAGVCSVRTCVWVGVGVYLRCVYVRGCCALRVYVDMWMIRKRTRGERYMYTAPMCVAYVGTGDVRTVYVLGIYVCR